QRFAIVTFEGISFSENKYSALLQEHSTIRIDCVMCCNNRKEQQVVLVGGGEELTSSHLRELCEAVIEKVTVTTAPCTLAVGISSIAQAQAAASLPQLIAESARAVRVSATETISKLQDAVWRIKRYVESEIHEDLRSEEHTSELQSRENLVCRLLLEKKKKT